jgi:hypothetical protein
LTATAATARVTAGGGATAESAGVARGVRDGKKDRENVARRVFFRRPHDLRFWIVRENLPGCPYAYATDGDSPGF